jgi:hypothetical protein
MTGCINYPPEQGVVLEVGFPISLKNLGKKNKLVIKHQKRKPVNQLRKRT